MIKRVRLIDVAEKAGVAVNTASTILNKRPNSWASKETEARVFSAAAELCYRPNKTAQALRSGRFLTIGLVIQDLTNPFFCTIADELEAAVEARGYSLLVENCRSSQVLWLSDNELFREKLAQKYASGSPMVVLGNGVPEVPIPCDAVLSDFTQGLQDAIDALCALGHQRFAFLSAHADGTYDGSRALLFQQMLAAKGIQSSAVNLLRSGHTADAAFIGFQQFLSKASGPLPTALIAMNDIAAIGAMRAAKEFGLKIPDDISIVGVDDIPLCAYLPITLSSIRQRYKMITQAAAELLISRITDARDVDLSNPRQVICPTIYTARESVGPAK